MGGAVFGRLLELDEAAADPVRPEFRSSDLEVDVGLAARFRDLAPAGADLMALAGIDPVIGCVVGSLVDRNDADRCGDVEGLEGAGEDAVVELGEGAECDSHDVFLSVDAQEPFLRCLKPGDRERRRYHRELASGWNAMEGLGDGKIWSVAARKEIGLPVGEIFSA